MKQRKDEKFFTKRQKIYNDKLTQKMQSKTVMGSKSGKVPNLTMRNKTSNGKRQILGNNNRRMPERNRSNNHNISRTQNTLEERERETEVVVGAVSVSEHKEVKKRAHVRKESPIIKPHKTINKHPSASDLNSNNYEIIDIKNAYNDNPQLETINMINTDEKSIFENEQEHKELRSESGKLEKILSKPYANDVPNTKSRKDEIDNLSLSSHRPTGSEDKGANSSIYGKLESFRDSKISSIVTTPDWKYTGLYKLFNLQYQNYMTNNPKIVGNELKVTEIPKPLSEFIFDKYNDDATVPKPDIFKDSQASIALKYIKKGLKGKINKTYAQDDSSSDEGYQNESNESFAGKCRKYFLRGMDTLKYLMGLLNLHKNYSKILYAYRQNNNEDIMK